MDRIKNSRLTLLLGSLLAAVTLAAFWPVIHYDFVNCDDQAYVYANPALQAGLSWPRVAWAFTTGYAGNWHPLTWLSHLLDAECFGLNAGWHHLTSLLLHVANSLLLFLALKRMTGACARSAVVAALFALHPLHVESVAWIAERKDVLSAFFFMLTLWAYARYVESQSPKSEVRSPKSESAARGAVPSSMLDVGCSMSDVRPCSPRLWYGAALVLFALGLMSKPMLVTLPFVLLLLDYWPLGRMQKEECRMQNAESAKGPGKLTASARQFHPSSFILHPLLLEKLPFFALAAASSVVTFLVQQRAGAVAAAGALPLELRLENALAAYLLYLARTLWPSGLTIFYPYRYDLSASLLAVSTLVLLGLSALAWFSLRQRPYLAVGWLWFLGTLVPVIGLVQVGQQALADRYTYLPLIGIFIAVVWAAAECGSSRQASVETPDSPLPSPRPTLHAPRSTLHAPLSLAAAIAIAACLALTCLQVRHWQNSETLFRHALAVTPDNAFAHESLGDALARQGRVDEAEPHFAEAVRIWPRYPEALGDLGLTRVMRGKLEEGIELYRAALALEPGDWKTHNNLARALCLQRKFAEAVKEYRTALELNPAALDTRGFLAAALVELGRTPEARTVFEDALKLKPDDAAAHFKYASLLLALGQTDAAALHFQAALRYEPGNAETHRRYGLLLAGRGQASEAIEQFRAAIRLHPEAETYYNLATALLQQGQPGEAIQEYRESLRLRPDSPAVLNDLAWVLAANPAAGLRNGTEAVSLAERACQLTQFRQPFLLGTLAAAYAEAGRFADAVRTAGQASDLAAAAGQTALAARNRQLLDLYRAGKPFHEPLTP